MTPDEARTLAWDIGGDVMMIVGLLVVYMVGLAVMGAIRR